MVKYGVLFEVQTGFFWSQAVMFVNFAGIGLKSP
jgi:hypothetical protein